MNAVKESKMSELPADWWKTARVSSILIDLFIKHTIPLYVSVKIDNQFQYNIYSGILLVHRGEVIWLTAGHVVDELQTILSGDQYKLENVVWLDGYHLPEAGSVRLHSTKIPMKSWRETGLDFGAVKPHVLDSLNLLQNKKLVPIQPKIWINLNKANPEGYYAIGFPRSLCRHSREPVPNNKILTTIHVNYACLPLLRISPPIEFADVEGWNDPEAFYGKVIPYIDYPEFDLDDVKGMSGGPILSVERDSGGQIRYRLVGIIQSYAPSQSYFRAEPIQKIAIAIDTWLDEMES